MEEILLNLNDNTQIAINHYRGLNRESVVLICPGCFMSKDASPFLELSDIFFKDYDVIAMDFRGHGRSTGLFTFTAEEPKDVCAVVKFAKNIYPKIGIIGFSLGGATSIIYVADKKDVHSVIVVSGPVDFSKVENHFLKKEAVIPAMKKFEFGKSFNIRPGNIFLEKKKPVDIVDRISPIPILFISGTKDPIVHPWHAQKLYARAKEPKAIEVFDQGLHAEDIYLENKDKFETVCKRWFDSTLAL